MREWAASEARRHPEVRRLGYFGSYARGDWGVGSDVDLIAVVGHSDAPFERRALGWDTESLPVPAELLVYTEAEFAALCSERRRFARMLEQEAVWVLEARDAS